MTVLTFSRSLACFAAGILFFVSSHAQTVTHVVISEFATRGPAAATDEFVEMYNPTDNAINLASWVFQYKSATGTTWFDRAILPSNAMIPARGFFLIANTSYVGTVTPDFSSGSWTSGTGMADNGNIRIIDNTLAEIDRVGYGSGNDPEGGSPAPNHGTSANSNSVERKAVATSTANSLAPGGADASLGNGYDTNVNGSDFVTQSNGRNPQNSSSPPEPPFQFGGNGTGTVTVDPSEVFTNRALPALTFSFVQDSNYTLTTVRLVIPPEWTWSGNLSDVLLSGLGFQSASKVLNGDTVEISSAAIDTAQNGSIAILNVMTPAALGFSTFSTFTGLAGETPAPLAQQPIVRTLDLVPIVLVHVNDAQGVPAPPYQIGGQVTVTGVVTANLSSARTEFYLQDASAGINVFSFDLPPFAIDLGDSIAVTGSIIQFRGLTEISPEFPLLVRHATGRTVPDPMIVTCADVNNTFQPDFSEPNESRLIRINGVTYNSQTSTITDNTGTTAVFIPSSFPPAPSQFDIIGVLKQFKPGTPAPGPPFTADYEIVPRDSSDIIPHPGPVITSFPFEDSIQPTSVRIQWTTDVASTSIIRFGTDRSSLADSIVDVTPVATHSVTVPGLSPATVYYYDVGSGDANGTNFSSIAIFSTASPSQATGQINVYFNKSVDTSLAWYQAAAGSTDFVSLVVQRINNAHRSIDAALYSLSGTPGSSIATALVNAKNRGVQVRVIGEYDNINSSGFTALTFNSVPLINDRFDPFNNGVGLHHNKFFVFDGRGGAPESVWVWTGSWNPTDPGTSSDYQNVIELQDPALAGAYLLEFNEMWGSTTQVPNASQSRFGSRKQDNSPHRFVINGVPVQSYFSPSDRTTSHILETINSAQHSAGVNILTFTRSDLADALIAQHTAGRKVRGVLDNNTDTGSEFNYLLSNGLDVHLKTGSGLLHHKYLIVDAEDPNWNPVVLTGSHNWSSAAENSNNENTLIIRDGNVANQYLQEFAARYYQFGGMDPILVGVDQPSSAPSKFALNQNYPNPFNPETIIQFEVGSPGMVTIAVYDILGRLVKTVVNEPLQAGTYKVPFRVQSLASGIYLYRLSARGVNLHRRMVVVK
ncbi:MAG TPA: phospholipase D-like domain-containing protein [Bacteroidota bacterium]